MTPGNFTDKVDVKSLSNGVDILLTELVPMSTQESHLTSEGPFSFRSSFYRMTWFFYVGSKTVSGLCYLFLDDFL